MQRRTPKSSPVPSATTERWSVPIASRGTPVIATWSPPWIVSCRTTVPTPSASCGSTTPHVGDARATDMASAGMVTSARWCANATTRTVSCSSPSRVRGHGHRRARVGRTNGTDDRSARRFVEPRGTDPRDLLEPVFVFPDDRSGPWVSARRGHRAIGVEYQPEQDTYRNWVRTILGRRYDAFILPQESGTGTRTPRAQPKSGCQGDTAGSCGRS